MNKSINQESYELSDLDEEKLRSNLKKFLKFDPDIPRPFAMNEYTVHNFYGLFMSHTYPKLKKINPDVIQYITIRVDYLTALIKKAPKARYVKISIVQVPQELKLKTPNKEMFKHRNNLYFLFTLSNGSNAANLKPYYDLNTFNDKMIKIPEDVAQQCLDEFNNLDKPGSLRKGLLGVVENNTEYIYMDMHSLVNDYLKKMKACNVGHIALVFCEIDKDDQMANENERTKAIIAANDNHFACLMIGVEKNLDISDEVPVYDFNELCPNMCPKE